MDFIPLLDCIDRPLDGLAKAAFKSFSALSGITVSNEGFIKILGNGHMTLNDDGTRWKVLCGYMH